MSESSYGVNDSVYRDGTTAGARPCSGISASGDIHCPRVGAAAGEGEQIHDRYRRQLASAVMGAVTPIHPLSTRV